MTRAEDLYPRPAEIKCSFRSWVHHGLVRRASMAIAERLHVAVAKGGNLSPFAIERLKEHLQGWSVWLTPDFVEHQWGFDWCEQQGTIQILLPDNFRFEVAQVIPPTCEQTGYTLVNKRFVINQWSRMPLQKYARDKPLKEYAQPEVLRAQIDPESLFSGWIVTGRKIGQASVSLELERRFLIGTAPNQWEDDWPVPFFPEADRLSVEMNRELRVITEITALFDTNPISRVVFTDINLDSGLAPQQFDVNPFNIS